jgi:hypothetical protein
VEIRVLFVKRNVVLQTCVNGSRFAPEATVFSGAGSPSFVRVVRCTTQAMAPAGNSIFSHCLIMAIVCI